METPPSNEAALAQDLAQIEHDRAVRRDERERLATWFDLNAERLVAFGGSEGLSPDMVSFLLRLEHDG